MHPYDKDYQTPGLFGEPLPALVDFFRRTPRKLFVWDLGAGQGRNTLALAALGHRVCAVDVSAVGLGQLEAGAPPEPRSRITLLERDIYELSIESECDALLLDSMFHFYARDKKRELELLHRLSRELRPGGLLVLCVIRTQKTEAVLKAQLAGIWAGWEVLLSTEELHAESNGRYRVLALQKPPAPLPS